MERSVRVLCTDSFTAPFAVGREGIGSAMAIALSAFANERMYKQRRRVKGVEEGGKRGNESGMPTILGKSRWKPKFIERTGTGGEKIQATAGPNSESRD